MGSLIFILVSLFTIYSIIALVIQLAMHNIAKAKKTSIILGIVLGIFFVVLFSASFASKSNILPMKQDKCFDEWCVAVMSIHEGIQQNGTNLYNVTLRITNKGNGRPQRPDNPLIYAVDDQGNRFYESPTDALAYASAFGKQSAINQLIQPKSSFTTVLVFRIPANKKAYVVLTEGGWPTYFIIGDEGSFFHKESLTPLN